MHFRTNFAVSHGEFLVNGKSRTVGRRKDNFIRCHADPVIGLAKRAARSASARNNITVGGLVAILDSFAIYRRAERIRASLSGHRSSRSKEKKRETERNRKTLRRDARGMVVEKDHTWLWTSSRREDASEGEKSR